MSTLREAAIGAMGALETARNGLAWYRDRYPESTDGSDDEAAGDIDAAIDALRAELAKPDAPAAAPGGWQGLTEQERTKAVSAIEGYGTDFVAPIYAVIEGIERTLFERNTPRPAPAEPQGAEAPQEIKSLRDRIIEGELELDGTHPPTLMFLMAEHWKAVATEHYAKAKDYDRLKHELRLSRTAPAPQPAGGERERYEFVLAQCREAQDIAASRGWALNDIATASTTDPRARKIATEALLSALSQPAAQQEPAVEHCLWSRNGHARCPIPQRKPLADEQIDRHSIAAVDCPPSSTVILVSSLRRLLNTKGDGHD